MIGESFSHYQVTGKLGAGGMGEVYRATDTDLNRDVAIKILPPEVTKDPERLARFRREAQVLASLNHPHIASIYGLEEIEGRPFLVLELVEGEDLSERLKRGPIAMDEVLEIAEQIAEAVEEAHEKGIVHRDLKPGNIKMTSDGKVKVLDFGLAKAYGVDSSEGASTDLSQSPTLTRQTAMGVILGTAAYMSPEQAKGKAVDRRTDIWAYGCVLYEMLTGKKAFDGEDVSEILAAVIRGEPDWSVLPAHTPTSINRLLHRCLEKGRKRRLGSIDVARLEIGDSDKAPLVTGSPATATTSGRRWSLALTLGTLLVGALLGSVILWNVMRPPPLRIARLQITPLADELFVTAPGRADVTISPDGEKVIYRSQDAGEIKLFARRLDQFEAAALTGLGNDPQFPFFSPNNDSLGFYADGALKKISFDGGPVVTLCKIPSLSGASWGPDDTIIFAIGVQFQRNGLLRISAAGGEPEILTIPAEGELSHRWPEILPNGRAVLFEVDRLGPIESSSIAVLSLETGEYRVLLDGGSNPRYLSTRHIVYAGASNTLWAAGFDPDQLEVTSAPAPVLENVQTRSGHVADFGISKRGTLVYLPADDKRSNRGLVWVDRQGNEESLSAEQHHYQNVALSPDGGHLAMEIREDAVDIWILDLERGTTTRFTFDERRDRYPAWSADGRWIFFHSDRNGGGVFRKLADGTGVAEQLTSELAMPLTTTPDGRMLALHTFGGDLHLLEIEGEPESTSTSTPLLQSPFAERAPSLSPDGRWLAYQSNESGHPEIYVRPFPNVDEGKWQISNDGGTQPAWAPDGRELFFRSGESMVVVPVEMDPSFEPGHPSVLFESRYFDSLLSYAVAADGRRFLMIKEETATDGTSPPPQIHVVLNWFEELKRLVPTNN